MPTVSLDFLFFSFNYVYVNNIKQLNEIIRISFCFWNLYLSVFYSRNKKKNPTAENKYVYYNNIQYKLRKTYVYNIVQVNHCYL